MRKIHLSKFEDKPHVMKTSLMFVEDGKICDGCDAHGVRCDSLLLIGGGVSILCQDCIEGILESLDSSAVRDIKIDKILQ
jgi:L-asparaginase II